MQEHEKGLLRGMKPGRGIGGKKKRGHNPKGRAQRMRKNRGNQICSYRGGGWEEPQEQTGVSQNKGQGRAKIGGMSPRKCEQKFFIQSWAWNPVGAFGGNAVARNPKKRSACPRGGGNDQK